MPIIMNTTDALAAGQQMDLTLLRHLRPLIFGPKALLHRYSQPAEKITIDVGSYVQGAPVTYPWPGRLAGSTIDLAYVKVWIQNALLNYFNDYVGGGDTVAPVASYTNRIRSSNYVFQTANGYARSSVFGDRDVQIGDVLFTRATVASVPYVLWTSVVGLIPDIIPSSVGAATSSSSNAGSQAASVTCTQTPGTPINDIVAVANGAAYSSLADGYINRTYTITCIQSSTGHDATTGLLQVVSADGLDNQASVTPAAFGAPTSIGTHGLTVTFSDSPGHANSFSASSSTIDEADLLVGQQWVVTVSQLFAPPTPTSGGVYNGLTSTTYVATVTLGGKYTDLVQPQITISTTTGVDSSGPTTVTAAATPVAIGTQGTTVRFAGTYLRKGDVYFVPVTAAGPGAVKTLVLNNDLLSQQVGASALDLRLFTRLPVAQIPATTLAPSALTYWTDDQTNLTLNGNVLWTATGFTSGGVPQYFPLVPGAAGKGDSEVFLEYREWDPTLAGAIYSLNLPAQVEPLLGVVDPDNPIAFAANLALLNTATTALAVIGGASGLAPSNTDIVKVVTTAGDPTTGAPWTDVLDLITDESDVYGLVPLTTIPTVQAAVAAHCAQQSTSNTPFYRACWLQGVVTTPEPIVTSNTTSDRSTALATISLTPGTSAYTTVNVPAGDSLFVTNGVQPGDTVRYQYSVDPFGNATYTTYTVAQVVSETTLILQVGPGSAFSTPQRLEIWRYLTGDQIAAQLVAQAATYASNRVCLVWPDQIVVNGVACAGYYAAAILAGLTGSLPCQQGLKNMAVLGVDSGGLPRSRNYLRNSQLDTMGAGGLFVLTTDSTGQPYVRWAVTTNTTTIQNAQEMMRRNLDNLYLDLLIDAWGDLIGTANITQFLIALIGTRFTSLMSRLARTQTLGRLGPPAVATLGTITTDPVLADRLQVTVTATIPFPHDQDELQITI